MNPPSTASTPRPPAGPALGVHSCSQCATRQVCLLGRLPSAYAELLNTAIEERPFSKLEPLEVEGVVAQRIAVVKVGTVMATRRGDQHQARPVALFGRGRVLGQYSAYGHPEQLGVTALSSGRLCRVRTADLYRLGVVNHPFHETLQTMIVHSYGQLADWSRVIRIKGLANQLRATLILFAKEQGQRTIRLPSQVALAALLSTTRETIARTLRQLEQGGHLVRTDRWHCHVVDTSLDSLALGT